MERKKGAAYILFGSAAIFFSCYWMLFETGVSVESFKEVYSYFTNQVTALSGIYLLAVGSYYLGAKKLYGLVFSPVLKTAVMAYAAIVGLGYYIGVVPFSVFTSEELWIFYPSSIYNHFINPALLFVAYIITPFKKYSSERSSLKTALVVMIYPSCYLLFAEFLAAAKNFYVYPFLNPEIMGGTEGVVFVSLTILVAGSALVFYIAGSGRKKARQQNKT